MKNMTLLFLLFIGSVVSAQVVRTGLDQFLTGDIRELTSRPSWIKKFYTLTKYDPVWLVKWPANRVTLLALLADAPALGLRQTDYQYEYLQRIGAQDSLLKTQADSLEAEVRMTDAALHVYANLSWGNDLPVLDYTGLAYNPECLDIPEMVYQAILENRLSELPARLASAMPEIPVLLKELSRLTAILRDSHFQEDKIISLEVNQRNKPLLKKLYYLGVTDSPDIQSDSSIKAGIKKAQQRFNLLSDGILRTTLLEELNIPLRQRAEVLTQSVNYYRWLSCLATRETTILVNVPAADLTVYDHAAALFKIRVIVGKYSTPTPFLSSRISDIVLYPYWIVPYKIATRELLPVIRENPAFLEANNFQVLNSKGRVVDATTIAWSSLGPSNFPYTLRQSTGCDNAMGLIKFSFPNPYSVYLHDTPGRGMFLLNKRYFSHGCMRLEDPLKLARLLVPQNRIAIDTFHMDGNLDHPSPVVIATEVKMPIIVWYNLAGVSTGHEVVYYEDVYKKNRGPKSTSKSGGPELFDDKKELLRFYEAAVLNTRP